MLTKNISVFSLQRVALYFKGMLNSINFYKIIFLHVIYAYVYYIANQVKIEQCFKRFYKDCPRQIPHRWIPSWSIPTGWIPTLSNSYLMNSHLVNSHPVIFHSVNFSLETTFPVKNGQENKLKLSAFTMTFCFANGIFLTSLRVLIVVNYPM